MIGERKQWQLPIISSNFSERDWVHKWSKFHYFDSNVSLCDKYEQDTDYYETYPKQSQFEELTETSYCKICLSRLKNNKK